ncbi:MAG: phosphatidate cytidylyltransferase, partial [Candidatus Neomarinimicrobiota bacterium]
PEGTLGLSLLAVLLLLVMVLQTGEVLFAGERGWLNLSAHVAGVLWIAGFGGTFILVRSGDLPPVPGVADLAFRVTMALYVSVWVCDSLAYGMGRRFGRRKIIPRVSPNKTVVGTVSGALGALATMLLLGAAGWLPGEVFSAATLVALGLIVGAGGQMGDFVESRLKRDFNVKDTGALLPGHGGVLDRFDSLLFVMPLTYLYLALVVHP